MSGKPPILGIPPIPGVNKPPDLPSLKIDGKFSAGIKAPQLDASELAKIDLLDTKLALGISLPAGSVAIGFELQELKPSLTFCGFKLALTIPGLSFNLPPIAFPPRIDLLISFELALGINCLTENPLNVTGEVKFGGGRKPNVDPDPDDQYAEVA